MASATRTLRTRRPKCKARTASAGYHCAGKDITNGRGVYCLTIGALQVDEAVERAVLAALAPIGVEAEIAAAERLEADHDGALAQWRLTVERASYETQRAERRYRAVEPDNRLVARGLEELPTRMRAGSLAIAYEHPKLAISTNVGVVGFASRMEAFSAARGVSPVIDSRQLSQPADGRMTDPKGPGDIS